MQTELLDRSRIWDSRAQLVNALFEWIEVFSDRQRHHSTLDDKSLVDYDRIRSTAPVVAAWQPNPSQLSTQREEIHLT